MKRITKILCLAFLVGLFIVPVLALAQPVSLTNRECCKIKTEMRWQGNLNGSDCSKTSLTYCIILKGATLGPELDTKCHLENATKTKNTDGTYTVDSHSPEWGIPTDDCCNPAFLRRERK